MTKDTSINGQSRRKEEIKSNAPVKDKRTSSLKNEEPKLPRKTSMNKAYEDEQRKLANNSNIIISGVQALDVSISTPGGGASSKLSLEKDQIPTLKKRDLSLGVDRDKPGQKYSQMAQRQAALLNNSVVERERKGILLNKNRSVKITHETSPTNNEYNDRKIPVQRKQKRNLPQISNTGEHKSSSPYEIDSENPHSIS